ncbi:glutamic acid-rich [Micractinium conductrix]|uniref:Glutamic acid-rich n=1 Tax=Micractinium conductrix TaxID=554055 RepID=A0A2P6V672_9CHLO|nr:glutamic acid-rich [Micractinium conductrix]|eukprot:PSC69587.1 glutamic acid-rich [Micractinium conductrix]
MTVDEAAVRAAVKARREYILENLDSMTLKSCRQTLEQDMGLESGALKAHKSLLSAVIDKLLAKNKQLPPAAPAAQPPRSTGKASRGKEAEVEEEEADEEAEEAGGSGSGSGSGSEEEEEEKPRKRRKGQEGKPAKASGPRQYSKQVEKLRSICKAATITIPPNLYIKHRDDEAGMRAALEALLDKHGLDGGAGEREISKARAALQVQRDLDGIDTSNIIEGGRRRRGAAPVSYKKLVQPASDSEEEDGSGSGSDSGSDEGAGSGSDAEASGSDGGGGGRKAKPEQKAAKAAPARKQKAAQAAESGSEEEEEAGSASEEESAGFESAGEESEEEAAPTPASGGKKAAGKKAVSQSPNENAAPRGNGGSGGKAAKPTAKPAAKAVPADSLEDSDAERTVAAGGKRRAVTDWSDDE